MASGNFLESHLPSLSVSAILEIAFLSFAISRVVSPDLSIMLLELCCLFRQIEPRINFYISDSFDPFNLHNCSRRL